MATSRLRSCLITSLLIGLAIFLGLWIRYRTYIVPYEEFRDDEVIANPKFAALNDALYSQVTLPNGVHEERKSQHTTLDSSHGVYMSLDYLMANTTPSEVQSYYEDFFIGRGYKKYEFDSKGLSVVYYRGTGCYDINLYINHLGEISKEYGVHIYHDFFEQEFSPKIPSSYILASHEFGETSFIRCPPFLDPPIQP